MNKKVCVGMREELHNFGHDALLPVLGKDNRKRAIWDGKGRLRSAYYTLELQTLAFV